VGRAFQKGLLLLGCGKSSLRLAPPLVVDEYDVDTALRIIDECLREMSDLQSRVMSLQDAVARFVRDGDVVVIEGFTHLISFAAGHEIIRQRRRDLTLCRLTPDLIYDQMIAAGCASKLVFSWAAIPGSARCTRSGARRRPGARDRGILALRDGGAILGRRGAAAVLDAARL